MHMGIFVFNSVFRVNKYFILVFLRIDIPTDRVKQYIQRSFGNLLKS